VALKTCHAFAGATPWRRRSIAKIAEEWQSTSIWRTLENIRPRNDAGKPPAGPPNSIFGNRGYIKDLSWEERGGGLAETVWQDLKFGIRQLWKSSGFYRCRRAQPRPRKSAQTPPSFSYIDAWMIKPLPYPQPGPAGEIRDTGQETRMDEFGRYVRGRLLRFPETKLFLRTKP